MRKEKKSIYIILPEIKRLYESLHGLRAFICIVDVGMQILWVLFKRSTLDNNYLVGKLFL